MQLKCLSDYARAFGLLFQITDDLADSNENDEPSFVKAVGREKAVQTCEQLVTTARQALDPFGDRARGLKNLVSFLNERNANVPTA
jgi:geranylgeranyl pyrophosphate synthase